MCPVLVPDDVGLEPERAVGQQLVAAQLGAEYLGAKAPAFVFAGLVQARALPGVRIHLDQERAQLGAVLVAVRDEHAVRRLAEDQRHRVKALPRAIPGELVAAFLEARPELIGELPAHGAVAAIGSDDQVDLPRQRLHLVDARSVLDLHAHAPAGALQRVEHVDAGRAREVVAVNLHMGAAVHHLHVVALFVVGGELGEELGVGLLQEAEADVREHDAPTVGGTLRVLLVDADLVRRVVLLREHREVQAGRAGADDGDLHGRRLAAASAASRSAMRFFNAGLSSLPTRVSG